MINIYEEMDVVGHVRDVGPYLLRQLQTLNDHPLVGDVRGVGLLTGVELVRDKATRALYDPAVGVGRRMDANGHKNGLILRIIGDRIAFAPPLVIERADIDEIVNRFKRTLDETWAEVGSGG